MTRTALLLSGLLVACGSKTAPPADPIAHVDGSVLDVAVEVASVVLGDDCASPVAALEAEGEQASEAKCRPDSPCSRGGGGCVQTQVQLSVQGGPVGTARSVRVVKVELLDASGQAVDELAARQPKAWDDASGTYAAWDGLIAADETIGASFDLSAPDWSAVPGGRWAGSVAVRVTLAIGDEQTTRDSVAASPGDLDVVET